MNQHMQSPHFASIPKFHETERELIAAVNVVAVKVYGKYTKRGEHRKEVVEADFEAEVEVPENFNKGDLKLASNRHIRKKLNGIRVRTLYLDDSFEPKKVEHKRRVRDFMSEKGLRDNARQERQYNRAIEQRKAEQDSIANGGAPPTVMDNTQYSNDGLMPVGDKYVDV